MARIQILELPTIYRENGVDETPFVLVIDQVTEVEAEQLTDSAEAMDGFGVKAGARAVAVFHGMTMDIPANDPLSLPEEEAEDARASLSGPGDRVEQLEAKLRAAFEVAAGFEAQRDEARLWARHGYEIGQKHCGWTDHGVAPAWLTEGWPPHFDSCEHLKRAAEYDEALTRVRGLPEHPEIMDARHEQPHGYLHGYKVAIRDAKRAAARVGESERSKNEAAG